MRRAGIITAVLALVGAGSASAEWQQPIGGASPINRSSTAHADDASLASVGGVPYVAWDENFSPNGQVRVARLNASGSAWERVVDGPSPISHTPGSVGAEPSIAEIDGTPHIAWVEADGTNFEVRVARLNAAGSAWEEIAPSASPINQDPARQADFPSLAAIGNTPYVAWQEWDGTNSEIRVDRLNAAGTAWESVGQGLNPASPINKSSSQDGSNPSLTSIGGVPYIAWFESDGTNNEIRVARLNNAGTGWEKVADSASPINSSPTGDAAYPSLIGIGGTPYVAFGEFDGTQSDIRVARLNAAGTSWEQVPDVAAPVDASLNGSGNYPSLAELGGVPYLSWSAHDGTNNEIRVARLNSAETAWEELAGSASPINESASQNAQPSSLALVNGIPYVAWNEDDGTNRETRVSRLEPEFTSQSVSPGTTTASLSATWHTYGLGYSIGFDYGASLENSTGAVAAPHGVDSPSVTQEIAGLAPSSTYQLRSFATAGVPAPQVLAPYSTVFQTTAPDTAPPETTITKDPPNKLEKSKAKYKFKSSEPNSTFVCKFDKKKAKPCNAGKLKLKRLEDGKHKFRVYAVDATGNEDPSPAKDRFKVL